MSVIGRLWRRAPAWRLWLFVALATTGLAAMFPPSLPSLPTLRASAGPHFVPPPTPAASNPTTPERASISMLPITGTRQTLIPFAGRLVPLPQGKWSDVALVRADGPTPRQGVMLARVQSGKLTGLMIVFGTPATAQNARIALSPCVDPTGNAVHVLGDPNARDPALQECWTQRRLTTAAMVASSDPLESRTFARFGQLGIAVPAHLMASRYVRQDEHGDLVISILLPDPTESDGLMRRTDAWMRRWVMLLHRGFDGTLRAADVTPTLARDPGVAPA